MRIRDAITKPVVLVTAGALALSTITAITVIGSVAPPPESFRCVEQQATPREPVPQPPMIEPRFAQPPPAPPAAEPSCNEWFSGRRTDMPPPRCQSSD